MFFLCKITKKEINITNICNCFLNFAANKYSNTMYLKANSQLQRGRYRIIRFISSGGFGCTYEAIFTPLNKRVAIKEFFVKDFCNRDAASSRVSVATQSKVDIVAKLKRKFLQEANAIARFNHSNIVRVSDIFEENGTAYYVMDYINGKSLYERTNRTGALSEAVALKYIRQVANALLYVHSRNCLHLDLKPGNIMIDEHDNAILIDFGASKQYDEQGENTSTLLGLNTPGYAPPEQMSRSFSNFNPAADVYALGATLYKLLTNITPPDSVSILAGIETLSSLPNWVSPTTRRAVQNAMIPQRNKRTQTIAQFIDELDGASAYPASNASDIEVTVMDDDPTEPKQTPRPRPRQERITPPTSPRQQPKQKTAQKSSSKKGCLWVALAVIGVLLGIIILGSSGTEPAPEEDYGDTLEVVYDSVATDTASYYDAETPDEDVEEEEYYGYDNDYEPIDTAAIDTAAW